MDKVIIENLNVLYSDGLESLRDISLNLPANQVNVLFGPAGGGKSTLLRVLNRLIDLSDVSSVTGRVLLNGENILDPHTDVIALRRKVGIVFSRPTPLPLTIYQNISYGLEAAGEKRKARLDEVVERALLQATLWDEVNDRLNDPASTLSGGQQQRLCLARSLALEPELILLDEPTSALDPINSLKIESLLAELKEKYTVILVPHNVQMAARMADFAAFFLEGRVIETAPGKELFVNAKDQRTLDYVEGRFG